MYKQNLISNEMSSFLKKNITNDLIIKVNY